MDNQRFLSHLAFFASLLALAVVALGAFTRLMDAGLGCPDWPGCYGHMIVPITEGARQTASVTFPGTPLIASKAWAEMIHRYFVTGLSLFILVIVGFVLSNKEVRQRSNLVAITCLVVLLVYQIMLGQWTVTLKLLPVIVSQHLLGGYLILSTLWFIYINNRVYKQKVNINDGQKALLYGACVALALLLVQISLGAWTSTNYASLSCPDFPFCSNTQTGMVFYFKQAFNLFSPVGVNYEGGVLSQAIRQTIQMTHRLGALVLTLYLFGYMVFSMSRLKGKPELTRVLHSAFGLLCIQVCLGMANVIFKLPLVTAISHTMIAALLLLSMITLIYKLALTNAKDITI